MVRISKLLAVAGTALLLCAMQAHATDNDWYLAADLGYSRFNPTSNYSQPAMITPVTSESSGGYRIGGGYLFTEYFALEANYIDAGHTDVGADAVLPKFGNQAKYMRTHGVTIDAIAIYPVNKSFNIYLRAGLINATTERKLYKSGSIVPTEPDLSMHDNNFGIGLGVSWKFDDTWVIRTQWQRYYGLGNADIAVRGNLDVSTLGVVYYY